MRARSDAGHGSEHGQADAGQGSVELVAMLPILLAVGLALVQLLAAGVAHGLAANAAENAAIALGDGEDPADAAREALPGWAKDDVHVMVRGRRVSVRLQPLTIFPGAGSALATVAHADAGPAAGGSPSASTVPAVPASGFLGAPAGPTRDDPSGRRARPGEAGRQAQRDRGDAPSSRSAPPRRTGADFPPRPRRTP